jgi:type I restriction enzyme, S subunit
VNCLSWIKELPDSWTVKPLRAVADYSVSNVDKLAADDEIPVRLCNYTEVYNNEFITLSLNFMSATATEVEIAKFRILVDDVLITKDSESWDDIGVPALVTETSDDLLCGYHLALIRPHYREVDGRFLFRCLQAKPVRIQLELAANGVTRFGIPKSDIGGLKLPVPPLSEQRAIANLVDRETKRLDELIAAKKEMLALLLEKHRAIIARAVTHGVDAHAPLRESGIPWLGKIPVHWSVKRVKYIFNLVSEPAPEDNDFELLSLYTDIGVKPRKELEARGNKASSTDNYWLVRRGDLVVNKLLAWMGAFGVSEYEGVTSPAYDILRPVHNVEPFFYHYLFRSGICLPEIRRRSYGIMDMRLRLYFDRFGDMAVPVPPYPEQIKIVAAISDQTERFDRIKLALERTIELLKERRAALINAAVTGQIAT